MALTAKADLGRVALGAPALKEVFIVSNPDCLLIKSWARAGRDDAEDTAAQFGACFRSAAMALAAAAPSETTQAVTIEADGALLRLERVSDDIIAGFVFDRTAPLGLVHVQARQLRDHIQGSIEHFSRPDEAPAAPADAPPKPDADLRLATEIDGMPFSKSPDDADATGRFPKPVIPDVTTQPVARPRAVRLLDFFRRYAPDPHASLLRLSLRTGIPVERLETPDDLDDAQVDGIATAVRDILGQDQVGL